jgi:hypothetical protein
LLLDTPTGIFCNKDQKSITADSKPPAEDMNKVHTVFLEKPEIKGPFGRLRRRWENNIKMVIHNTVWGMEWIDLAQDRER